MVSLLVFLFILGILVVVHEFGHFIAAKKMGVRIENFSLGFGKKLWSKKRAGTEYSLNAIPLGGYVKLAGDNPEEYKGNSDEYLYKTPAQRALIIFFGPLLNYILGFLCFWLIFFAGYPTLTTRVGGLIDGFGAKDAGLQIGDRITAIDGRKVAFWEELQQIIQSKKIKDTVELSVLRQNKEYTIEVKLKEKQFDDLLGQRRSIALLGISPFLDEVVKVRHGPLASFILSMKKVSELTAMTYKALFRMVTGKLSMRESVTGPLGIFYVTSKVAQVGIIAVLHLIAVLSVSLAIFNLLPLPVLDGGHIFLLAVEKIRGKALSLKAEKIITRVGLTMIVCLALIATYNDILRLFGDRLSKLFK